MLFRSPDAKVRALAARALGRLGDNRALVPLQQVAKDADAIVRDKAQEAVKGLSAALPVAAESMTHPRSKEPAWRIRWPLQRVLLEFRQSQVCVPA